MRPADPPGRPLEESGNRLPREMATQTQNPAYRPAGAGSTGGRRAILAGAAVLTGRGRATTHGAERHSRQSQQRRSVCRIALRLRDTQSPACRVFIASGTLI